MDNGMIIEAFKFLKYCQLAKNSLVSNRFWNLIRTHRRSLAILDVDEIRMERYLEDDEDDQAPAYIAMFDKELSPEEYNELIVHNGYSKQIPFEGQIAEKESSEKERDDCVMRADVYKKKKYIDPLAFSAHAELKDENRPIFQHFVRFLTDPFIYIRILELIPKKYVLSLLTGEKNPDCDRLRCKWLVISYYHGGTQKFILWVKDHVRCDEFQIYGDSDYVNYDEGLLDFFLTGAPCTPKIRVDNYDLSKVIIDLVQKFMGLKSCDELQIVQSIRGYADFRQVLEELKRNYGEFIEEEEQFDEYRYRRQVVRFINNNIEKKLFMIHSCSSDFRLLVE